MCTHVLNTILKYKTVLLECVTREGVLVQLLQMGWGVRWSVDDLAIVDVGLSELPDVSVWSVAVLNGSWKQKHSPLNS